MGQQSQEPVSVGVDLGRTRVEYGAGYGVYRYCTINFACNVTRQLEYARVGDPQQPGTSVTTTTTTYTTA